MFNFILNNPHDSFRSLLERVPISYKVRTDLRARHTRHDRFYHGINHLATMWELHKYFTPPFNMIGSYIEWECRQQSIATAIAFHDAVYDTSRKDNEEQSALLWQAVGNDQHMIDPQWVYDSIIATKHHIADREPYDALREYFIGLDLAYLAAPYDIFDLNYKLLRLEYRHMSDEQWKSNGGFLHGLLKAPVIFKDERLWENFEEPARENIIRHLTELGWL